MKRPRPHHRRTARRWRGGERDSGILSAGTQSFRIRAPTASSPYKEDGFFMLRPSLSGKEGEVN